MQCNHLVYIFLQQAINTQLSILSALFELTALLEDGKSVHHLGGDQSVDRVVEEGDQPFYRSHTFVI